MNHPRRTAPRPGDGRALAEILAGTAVVGVGLLMSDPLLPESVDDPISWLLAVGISAVLAWASAYAVRLFEETAPDTALRAANSAAWIWVMAAVILDVAVVRLFSHHGLPSLTIALVALVPVVQSRTLVGQTLLASLILKPSVRDRSDLALARLRRWRWALWPRTADLIEVELLRDLHDLDALARLVDRVDASADDTLDRLTSTLYAATLAAERGDIAHARTLLDRYLEAIPKDASAMYLGAELALREGRADEAFPLARQASDLEGLTARLSRPWLAIQGAALRAWALWDLGQRATARQLAGRLRTRRLPPRVSRLVHEVTQRLDA